MQEFQLPLELVSNFISVVILILLFIKYMQYKKKLEVIKGLEELKESEELTSEDKKFIKDNLKDYKILLSEQEGRLKLVYPIFILIAGALLSFLEFSEAMIHLNIVIVAYIYLFVEKLHTSNFVKFLQELNKDLD